MLLSYGDRWSFYLYPLTFSQCHSHQIVYRHNSKQLQQHAWTTRTIPIQESIVSWSIHRRRGERQRISARNKIGFDHWLYRRLYFGRGWMWVSSANRVIFHSISIQHCNNYKYSYIPNDYQVAASAATMVSIPATLVFVAGGLCCLNAPVIVHNHFAISSAPSESLENICRGLTCGSK